MLRLLSRPTVTFYALSLMLISSHAAETRAVTLAWDPSPDASVTGYRVHYGLQSGAPLHSLDVGDTLTSQIPNLLCASDYYFVVTAYDASGLESTPSNEVMAPAVEVELPEPLAVALTRPSAGAEFNLSSQIQLRAEVEGDEDILHVAFFSGWTELGRDASPPYQIGWKAPTSGEHALTARVYHRDGRFAVSTPVSIQVLRGVWGRPKTAQADESTELQLIGESEENSTGEADEADATENETVVVEATRDFSAWEPIAVMRESNKELEFADPSGASKPFPRFYRTVNP